MPLTDEARRWAVQAVLRHWGVRACCRQDESRVGRIVDAVWTYLERINAGLTIDRASAPAVQQAVLARLQQREDYRDLISFIPVWIVPIIVKLIVSILVDFWLTYERGE